jgi:hypothetical protein
VIYGYKIVYAAGNTIDVNQSTVSIANPFAGNNFTGHYGYNPNNVTYTVPLNTLYQWSNTSPIMTATYASLILNNQTSYSTSSALAASRLIRPSSKQIVSGSFLASKKSHAAYANHLGTGIPTRSSKNPVVQ